MAEWLKASDCKSDLVRVRRFESVPVHLNYNEVPDMKIFAKVIIIHRCSSVVERLLGKDEVTSSILVSGFVGKLEFVKYQ